MRSSRVLYLVLTPLLLVIATFAVGAADKSPKPKLDPQPMIDKGLDWLKRTQGGDGRWEAQGGAYPSAMTGLAGMAMLMEGSTLREGKYSDNIVKAVKWFMDRAQPNGLLCNPALPGERDRYTYGHGFGLLFLASAYGEEDDNERRQKLEKILKNAVEFSCKAQTDKGGWGYVSALEGNNFDEGSTTITQLQALRAARNAGIPVPKKTIDNAVEYLRKCTTPRGGIIYNLSNSGVAAVGQERSPLTAAAVACSFSAGQYNDEYAKKWITYCKENIPIASGRLSHDEYQSYYLSQAIYILGEERYGEMFPKQAKTEWLIWSSYRDKMYEYLKGQQAADGSWSGGYVGPVYSTAVNLCILQLDKGVLPIYHR
jgi:hypothetical protein